MESAMEKRDIGHNSLEADSSLQKQITSEELESQAVDTADSNARLAGLEEDLGLKGYDYNIALSIFYIPYILLEIPSNMACILKLNDFGAVHTWKKIFVIEGIITCGIGIITFFTLSNSPATAKWLSEEERRIATDRVNQDHATQQGIEDKFDVKKVVWGIWNPVILASSAAFLLINITVQGVAFFTPTIVRTIYPDSSVVTQQLYTVPPYVVGAFFTVLLPYLMGRFDRRVIFYIVSMPFLVLGFAIFLGTRNASARYAALFFLSSFCMPFVVFVTATVSANTVSDATRSVGVGAALMFGNCGGLVATWSYVPRDAPGFYIASSLNIAVAVAVLVISTGLLLWMIADNRKRDRKMAESLGGWNGPSIEELEWRHPQFRWKL
ncbi:hypothetical protein ATERTT37_003334 [Aspergillus terreus]